MSSCVETTCPYCGVGCGVTAQVTDNRLVTVTGSESHPANNGKLCVKGVNLAETTVPTGRLIAPEVNGNVVGWDEAIGFVATEFKKVVDEYGPESIAFYLSGQLLTEDYYVANKLMKGFVGSANVDTSSRLCMSSAVAAHKRAFGEDVVPCTYSDLDHCDLIVLVGSNAAWAHPIIYQRIAASKQARSTKVVVIDPRKTSTCELADLHLPIRPGSDLALFQGLLDYLIKNDCLDHGFVSNQTHGIEAVLEAKSLNAEDVSEVTGLEAEQVLAFFELFKVYPNTVTMFSQGINQSVNGTDKANAIINYHLATGRIGQPGQGPFSITGQPNAMGGREVGGLANQLAAHMDFIPSHLQKVQRFWQAPKMASAPGLKAVDMFAALGRGEIKAIWIMGTNPAVSLPDSARVRRALAKCSLVVVSDCIRDTDTNQLANVLLPAQGWGEKDGTVTNSERCISRQRRLIKPIAGSKPDWEIICGVAKKMGFGHAFQYANQAEIFREHAKLSGFENNGERLFNISPLAALSDDGYDALTPTYWPLDRVPFQGAFSTPDGRARFVFSQLRGPEQDTSGEFPFVLNTGRLRDQWHTMSRTGLVAKLFNHAALPRLQIALADALEQGIESGSLVQVDSAHGSIRMLAEVSEGTPSGTLFAPIHWSDRFSGNACVNHLFEPVTDPFSGQPESKHAAVGCRNVEVQQWVRIVSIDALDPKTLAGVKNLLYWSGSPVLGGWQYEVAAEALEGLVAYLAAEDVVQYVDSLGDRRFLGRRNGQPSWVMFAGTSQDRLPSLSHIALQLTSQSADWRKLSSHAPESHDTSPVVCTCYEVRKSALTKEICAGSISVEALGKILRCGTNCGSCVPEINSLLNEVLQTREMVVNV